MKQHLNTRRRFLQQAGASLGVAALTPLPRSLAAVTNEPRKAATLEDAYRLLGFNPRAARYAGMASVTMKNWNGIEVGEVRGLPLS